MPVGVSPREFLDPSREWRRLFAEAWGTFWLVAIAVGASIIAAISDGKIPPWNVAAAPGLIVMIVIYFMGAVSGAHLNPVVTLAFAVRRNFLWRRVPGYLIAQIAGAVMAVLFLRGMFGADGTLGATLPGPHASTAQALAMEVLLSAGLINTVLGTASGARNVGANGAIAVGGYVALAGLWAAPISGASMNPARSIAPDLMRGDFSTTWIYIIGPLAGALIGVGFEWILKGPPTREGTLTAQGSDNSES